MAHKCFCLKVLHANGCMFRKPFKAQVGLFSSLIVGVFGGYWIKFLRWKELDDLDGLYNYLCSHLKVWYKLEHIIYRLLWWWIQSLFNKMPWPNVFKSTRRLYHFQICGDNDDPKDYRRRYCLYMLEVLQIWNEFNSIDVGDKFSRRVMLVTSLRFE